MKPKRPDDGHAQDVRLTETQSVHGRAPFPWPWGLVAIGIMAIAWVGIYLLWNGLAFLFGW